jgi:hypothetical protein
MFRRLLADFITMIRTGVPTIEPGLVLDTMKVLIAANLSRKENRVVELDEITI